MLPTGTIETRLTSVPLSTVFCADDADVVIRAAGSRNFRAHRFFLSLASPVFNTMFTLPQPPTGTLGTLPHVDVEESAETWENILRTIYPMPNPIIDDLHSLESLLFAAMKYEMQPIIEIHKKGLENRAFVQEDPLRLYAIACVCGLEDQAKYVARNAELPTIMARADVCDLRGLTAASYHSLVAFLTRRDSQWRRALLRIRASNGRCNCYKPYDDTVYDNIEKSLKVARLSAEEVYLKALEDRSRSRQSGCGAGKCSVVDSEIKAFIDHAIKERDKLYDGFVPGPLIPGLFVSYPNVPRRPGSTVGAIQRLFQYLVGVSPV